MRRAIFLLLFAGMVLQSPVSAQEEKGRLPLADYLRLAAETQASAEEADASARELAARWQAVTSVILPGGAEVSVDHSQLVAALRADPRDDEAIVARMIALHEVAARWVAPAYDEAGAAATAARLEAILARPAFQWEEQQPSFWQRLSQRVLRFLFDLIPVGSGALDIANVILAIAGSAILFLLLAFAARALFRNVRRDAAVGEAAGEIHNLTAEQALREAEINSQQGDYRSAVRYLYLSTLLLLEESGVLRYDRSRTNREYLRGLATRPDLFATLHSVVDVFDRVWYGFQPLDETSYTRYEQQVRALWRKRPE